MIPAAVLGVSLLAALSLFSSFKKVVPGKLLSKEEPCRGRPSLCFWKREPAGPGYNLPLIKGGKSVGGTKTRSPRNVMFFLELGPILHTNLRLSQTII